jgi:putative nucleotidyltransferase with HDIG domain
MRSRVLLVDGGSGDLRAVMEPLRRLAPDWECQLTQNGEDALKALSASPTEAVVADLRLPDLSGLQLMTRVLRQHPRTHRLLLADLSDLEALLRCVGTVHQLLAKPCDAARLQGWLQRAFALDLWLPNQAVRELLGRLPNMPSPPEVYAAVLDHLQRASPAMDQVAALIAGDPPLTAKVLQLVNAVSQGPPRQDADPVSAVKELGGATTKSLLLRAHSFSRLADLDRDLFAIDAVWEHSRRVARLAYELARFEGLGDVAAQQAATAGLLHDLGKLALAANLTAQFQEALARARTQHLPLWDAEQVQFGAHHGEVGGCLLGVWGLPVPVVEAVAMHHHPTRFLSDGFGPLAAVHVANALDHSESLTDFQQRVDRNYLRELGLESHLARWWSQCRPADPAADGLE